MTGNDTPQTTPTRRSSTSVPHPNAEVAASLSNNEEWTTDRVFNALDKSKDGFLDANELHLGITAVTGKDATMAQVEKLIKKFDVDMDGRLTLVEFTAFVKASKKGGGMKLSWGGKGRKTSEAVMSNREHITALELSATSAAVVTVSSLRLLPPPPANLVTALVYSMRYVETDLSRKGLYRACGAKITTLNKCMALITGSKNGRISTSEFRNVAGHDTRIVALNITKILGTIGPLIPYEAFDRLLDCTTGEELGVFMTDGMAQAAAAGTAGAGASVGSLWNQLSIDLLGSVMIHFHDLIKFQILNGMSLEAMAVPLSPLLFRRNEDVVENTETKIKVAAVFKIMVVEADRLFQDRDEFLWGHRERPDPTRRARIRNNSEVVEIKFRGKDYDRGSETSKEDEVVLVMRATKSAPSPSRWYVVPSIFVHDWLSYSSVKDEKTRGEGVYLRPTKLDNSKLLKVSPVSNMYYVDERIKRAGESDAGDYRLVNQATFKMFKSLYPGSGPAIFVDDVFKDDITEWWIDQSDSPFYVAKRKEQEAKEAREKLEDTADTNFDDVFDPGPVYEQNAGLKGASVLDAVMFDIGEAMGSVGDVMADLFSGVELFGADEEAGGCKKTDDTSVVQEAPEVERKSVSFQPTEAEPEPEATTAPAAAVDGSAGEGGSWKSDGNAGGGRELNRRQSVTEEIENIMDEGSAQA